ncbi:MAG: hypothetical protein RLZZ221_2246 [Verrucomicrobiota bacterium]
MNTLPESSSAMSICAPVVSVMRRMVLPPGPMSRPIFSGSIWIVWMRGAYLLRSARGAGSEASMTLRISMRASRACMMAVLAISKGRPLIFRSSWKPVIPLVVPASLKSMSPKWSSSPRMSVIVTHFSMPPLASLCVMRPQEMPATGAVIGTPASINERQPPQIEAIEVEPLDDMISLTTRME